MKLFVVTYCFICLSFCVNAQDFKFDYEKSINYFTQKSEYAICIHSITKYENKTDVSDTVSSTILYKNNAYKVVMPYAEFIQTSEGYISIYKSSQQINYTPKGIIVGNLNSFLNSTFIDSLLNNTKNYKFTKSQNGSHIYNFEIGGNIISKIEFEFDSLGYMKRYEIFYNQNINIQQKTMEVCVEILPLSVINDTDFIFDTYFTKESENIILSKKYKNYSFQILATK